MNKRAWIAGIFVPLILSPPASRGSEFKFIFSAGASYRPQAGYNYDYSQRTNPGNAFYPAEYGLGRDRVPKAQIYAPEFGLGLSYRNVSLAVFAAPYTGEFSGSYELIVPSMYGYNLIAAAQRTAESKVSGISLGSHLKYSIPLGRVVRAYAGAGIHVLWASLELLKDFVLSESYSRIPEVGFADHLLEILDIEFSPVDVNIIGLSVLGGVEFTPAPPYRIFLEGRYQSGKKNVPHPYYSQLVSSLNPVHLDFSGFVLSIGIRYSLDL